MVDIGELMKGAQSVQARLQEVDERLKAAEVSGTAGGGLINVTMTGKGDVVRISIEPTLFESKDVQVVEDLLVAALEDGRKKSEALAQEEMSKITGGLSLPFGGKLPF